MLIVQSVVLAVAGERTPVLMDAIALILMLLFAGVRVPVLQLTAAIGLTVLVILSISGVRVQQGRALFYTDSGVVNADRRAHHRLVRSRRVARRHGYAGTRHPVRDPGLLGRLRRRHPSGDQRRAAAAWPPSMFRNPCCLPCRASSGRPSSTARRPWIPPNRRSMPLASSMINFIPGMPGLYIGFLAPQWLVALFGLLGLAFGWFERWLLRECTPARLILLGGAVVTALWFEAGLPRHAGADALGRGDRANGLRRGGSRKPYRSARSSTALAVLPDFRGLTATRGASGVRAVNEPVNIADLGRLSRTVMQLRPAQIGQRARLRAQRTALDHAVPLAGRWLLAGPDPAAGTGWPAGFTPLDARLWRGGQDGEGLRAGELRLIGAPRVIAPAGDGGHRRLGGRGLGAADAPLLWRFHLYYWDWAWALAGEHRRSDAPAVFAAIWESWHVGRRPGRGAAWHPYPAALRAWSFCGIYRPLVRGSPIEEPFLRRTRRARRLPAPQPGNGRRRQPPHQEPEGTGRARGVLRRRRAARPVAPAAAPRSWPCRCCPTAATTSGRRPTTARCSATSSTSPACCRPPAAAEPAGLAEAIAAMRGWLGAVLTPRRRRPAAERRVPGEPGSCWPGYAPAAPPGGPLHVLPDTGLARATVGGWHLLADVGPPCPRELPGARPRGHPQLRGARGRRTAAHRHRHLHLRARGGTRPRAVDRRAQHRWSWTAATPPRSGGRSGPAAGPGSAAVGAARTADTVTVEAAHDGYRNLPGRPVHHRRWSLRAGRAAGR